MCYIIDQVNAAQDEKGAALTKEERFALLNRIILEIAPENKLNLLIFDGEIMLSLIHILSYWQGLGINFSRITN